MMMMIDRVFFYMPIKGPKGVVCVLPQSVLFRQTPNGRLTFGEIDSMTTRVGQPASIVPLLSSAGPARGDESGTFSSG